MFWLQRPPYARWAGISVLVVFAVWVDLRGRGTEVHPFASTDLAAGAPLTGKSIEWRDVPGGLLPKLDLEGKVAAHPLAKGDPITSSVVRDHRTPPDGWWSVELPLPEGTTAGTAARVVVDEPPLATEALVVSIIDGGAFERSTKGLVAVPAEFADALARASSRGNAIVLVAP